MAENSIDFGHTPIGSLFRSIFFPTLIGMIFTSVITVVDGMFVGHGVGADGIASVNIVAPTFMIATGIGLMAGIGASVIAGIRLSEGNITVARNILTLAFISSTTLALLMVLVVLLFPDFTLNTLGCSEQLKNHATAYMLPLAPGLIFVMIQCIGMMLIRLDGSPRYAMWCQAVPAVVNIVLDYIMIFPMGMGVAGAAVATSISCVLGGVMALAYFMGFSDKLKFSSISNITGRPLQSLRSVANIARIGFATFLTEIAMSVMMITGNYVFMQRLGERGVAAYSIACYLFPVVFSIANAVAQSAQPIVSYNYGAHNYERVYKALRVALLTAVICGALVTTSLWVGTKYIVMAFLTPAEEAFALAVAGLPIFATCAIFFAINITFIGYYQSLEQADKSIVYTMLRGIVILIPSFIIMPALIGNEGLWAAIPVAEFITMIIIISVALSKKPTLQR